VQHGEGHGRRYQSKVEKVRHGEAKTERIETKAGKGNGRNNNRSKQVSDSSVLSENDINALAPQLIELLKGHASGVCRNHPRISLCYHDSLQASTDAGEVQSVRDFAPQYPHSCRSKTQHTEERLVPGRGLHPLDNLFHDVGRAE
jgi:hypothetical protein